MRPETILSYGLQAHKLYKYADKMGYLRGIKADPPSSRGKYATRLDYRLAKIERNLRNVRPELKQLQHHYSDTITTGTVHFLDITPLIEQGNEEINRTGNEIRVKGLRITGVVSNNAVVIPWLNISPNAMYPDALHYQLLGIPQVKPEMSDDQKIMSYMLGRQGGHQILHSKRFPNGLVVKYNGTTGFTETQNLLTIGIYNGDTVDRTYNITVTVYFTDV